MNFDFAKREWPISEVKSAFAKQLENDDQFKQLKVGEFVKAYTMLTKKKVNSANSEFEYQELNLLKAKLDSLFSVPITPESEQRKFTQANLLFSRYKQENQSRQIRDLVQIATLLDSIRPVAGDQNFNTILQKQKNDLYMNVACILFTNDYSRGMHSAQLEKWADAIMNRVWLMDQEDKKVIWDKFGHSLFDMYFQVYKKVFEEKAPMAKQLSPRDQQEWLESLKYYQHKAEEVLFKQAFNTCVDQLDKKFLIRRYKAVMQSVTFHMQHPNLTPEMRSSFQASLDWTLFDPQTKQSKQMERQQAKLNRLLDKSNAEKERERLDQEKRNKAALIQDWRAKQKPGKGAQHASGAVAYPTSQNIVELVRIDPERGGLWLRNAAKAGQLLFAERPIVFKCHQARQCGNCFVATTKNVNQVQCEYCQVQYFCGEPCKTAAAKSGRHGQPCCNTRCLSDASQLLLQMLHVVGGLGKIERLLHEGKFRNVTEMLNSAKVSTDLTWELFAIGLILTPCTQDPNKVGGTKENASDGDDFLQMELLLDVILLTMALDKVAERCKNKAVDKFKPDKDGLFLYKVLCFFESFPLACSSITAPQNNGKPIVFGPALSPFGTMLTYVKNEKEANVIRRFDYNSGKIQYVAKKSIFVNQLLTIAEPKKSSTKRTNTLKFSQSQSSSIQPPLVSMVKAPIVKIPSNVSFEQSVFTERPEQENGLESNYGTSFNFFNV